MRWNVMNKEVLCDEGDDELKDPLGQICVLVITSSLRYIWVLVIRAFNDQQKNGSIITG